MFYIGGDSGLCWVHCLSGAFDVGVIGGGVGGSVCAGVLGEAGVGVALFDGSHPREKPCGGLIDDRVVDEFSIPEVLLENEVRWVLAERFGFKSRLFFELPVFLVSRKDFDYHLLSEASKSKSLTFFDERVNQIVKKKGGWILKTSKDRSVEVKILVGADGCPSLVRRCVFKPIPSQLLAMTVGYEYSCSKRYIEENFSKNTIEAYYSRRYLPKGGFLWIFPKRKTLNVGIGSLDVGKNLKQSLDRFIISHPAGKRLKSLQREFFAHLIPEIWSPQFFDLPCTDSNWALIGDAAGHVNAIGGMGIYYAMKGGKLCASAILEGDLQRYEEYWREDYGDELYYGAENVLRYYSTLGFFPWIWSIVTNKIKRRFSPELEF